jgi:hypothetical protein
MTTWKCRWGEIFDLRIMMWFGRVAAGDAVRASDRRHGHVLRKGQGHRSTGPERPGKGGTCGLHTSPTDSGHEGGERVELISGLAFEVSSSDACQCGSYVANIGQDGRSNPG